MINFVWRLVATGLLCAAAAAPAFAQERCDEATVRRLAAQPVGGIASSDIYFNTRPGEPPVVGSRAMESLRLAHASERRNQKPYVFAPLQVVSAADGSMAYDDGTARVEFDEANSGKHVQFNITYLRVWKVVDGQCRIAASYSRPVGQ
jgi:hypothetical protein